MPDKIIGVGGQDAIPSTFEEIKVWREKKIEETKDPTSRDVRSLHLTANRKPFP